MSTNDSSSGGRRIILNLQNKRRTPAQKQADDLHAHEIRDVHETATQQGLTQFSEMEAAMEVEQVTQEANRAKPVRPRRGMDQRGLTTLSDAPRVDADVGADPYHVDIRVVVAPNNRVLRRQNAIANVETAHALEQEKTHQRSVHFSSLTMLVLTESTLYWLNLTWNLSMLNKKTLLLGHINNWANEVRPSIGAGTSQNSAASNSQTGGKSYPPSSTVPSLTTNATSVSSEASSAVPAYRETPVPALTGFPCPEDEDDAQDPAEDVDSTLLPCTLPVRLRVASHHQRHQTVERTTSTHVNPSTSDDNFDRPISDVAQMGSKCRHAGYSDSCYVATSDMDDKGSNTGHGTQVELQTNVITEKPAKKPRTNLHGNAVTEGSGHLAAVTTITSQASSTGTNSTGSRRVHYINGHLPSSLQEDRRWTKLVLPVLVMWAGSLGDPWVIPDQDLMQALQIIIITVNPNFGDLSAIHPGALVFIAQRIVDQGQYGRALAFSVSVGVGLGR
ncbi:hypothetical protein EDD16DRAFT_1701501 [Pisolithus croceorrhizus]|nr:hypothetical protein EDD16DRAFT_1701501 [Pisolithus croceorrhizus]